MMTPTDSGGSPASVPAKTGPVMKLAMVVIGVALVAGGWWVFSNRGEETQTLVAVVLPKLDETKVRADAGDPEAQNTIGEIFAEGKQVKRDYKEAVNWYRKAAEKGVPRAQYHLGALYEIGQGVPHDDAEAARWYRKAAEAGLADAQYNLAGMYGLGRGVSYDPKQALEWYQKAGLQGDSLALYNLAERYERGRDVAQDRIEAYKWHSLAAERGLKDGEVGAASLKKNLNPEQLKEAMLRIEAFKKSMTLKPASR